MSPTERLEMFERLFVPEPMSGCWLWTGDRQRQGYGFCWSWGKRELAHRGAYKAYKGPIPQGMMVRHRCDTPCCVNPEHLVVGTHDDNMADKVARGRNPKGERHPHAKLTDADVRAIRSSNRGSRPLARLYGVSQPTILNIRHNRIWRHVEAH